MPEQKSIDSYTEEYKTKTKELFEKIKECKDCKIYKIIDEKFPIIIQAELCQLHKHEEDELINKYAESGYWN
jgi:hypothetical protein